MPQPLMGDQKTLVMSSAIPAVPAPFLEHHPLDLAHHYFPHPANHYFPHPSAGCNGQPLDLDLALWVVSTSIAPAALS
jgi:hypothetical protein